MESFLYSNRSSAGFTLVEVMVTVAVLGILMMIGVSLSGAWIDRANVDSASSSLKTAISQARVAALRNTINHPATEVATGVCVNSSATAINVYQLPTTVSVATASPTTLCANTNTLLKSYTYSSGTTFQQNSANITGNCFAFNSNGMLVSGTCASDLTTITVGKNSETATIDII